MIEEIEKIYFDMDGVLADFCRGVREMAGVEPAPQGDAGTPEADNRMWEGIRSVEHFYDRLELMPGAKEMFDRVYAKYGDRCEILTGIPKPKRGILEADEDKNKWVHRLLGKDIVVNIVMREQKPFFCKGKDCILIDDLEDNIADWERNGGTGIHHTSPEETMKVLRDLGVSF